MLVKKPWERRLKDLSHILDSCSATYFEPERFRINLNNFLQTSRTVTFIIQKNKGTIPDFDSWYQNNVLTTWSDDEVMTWAKNSRNVIEKEGDLEMLSTLNALLIFSYLSEEDIEMDCSQNGLLYFGVKKLIRFAQKTLPSSVSDAAVIKIERKWVANSLPAWELLHAISYIYSRMYECCQLLGAHLDSPIDNKIIQANAVDTLRENSRKVEYVKIRGMGSHHTHIESINYDKGFEPPIEIKKQITDSVKNFERPHNLQQAVKQFSDTAKITFNHYGNHEQMLFMLDKEWAVVSMITTALEDQAEKFIFWRSIGERVSTLNVNSLIWISESWIRDMNKNKHLAVRNMPIVGEKLQVFGINKENHRERITWDIQRSELTQVPTLIESRDKDFDYSVPYFFVPALRSMGLCDKDILSSEI